MLKKITKVEKQKRNKKRYSIFINDQFAFGVHEDILIKYELLKGKVLDENFIDEVLKAKEQNKANNYAISLLSYRARSEKEIMDKMTQKGYEKVLISNTITYLEKHNYLNDREFAIIFAKEKYNLKKYGKRRIETELYQKGVDQVIIDEVLNEIFDREDEYNTALELAQKKLRTSYKNDDKDGQYRKLGGYLQRRGYDFGIVMKILKELL